MSKIRVIGALATAAALIATPFIKIDEGERLVAYSDPVGIPTICSGATEGVKLGMKMSKEECDELTEMLVSRFAADVGERIRVPVSPVTMAAHVRFAYNIGINAYSRSQALKKTNAGDIAGGCRAMLNWYTAGGRDCRIKQNGCYGLINRRNSEVKQCLAGIQ